MSKILTTHVGSLPRSEAVTKIVFAREQVSIDGVEINPKEISDETFNQIIAEATNAVVQKQKQVGIDIPSDGEMSKISYATYIKDRLTNFEGDSPRRTPSDLADYKSFAEKIAKSGGTPTYRRPVCVGRIEVKDLSPLYEDINREKLALQQSGYQTGFMNSASPGVIALFQPSTYHKSHLEYLENLAEAMREEYEAIVNAGLYLQIDSPDLGLGKHMLFQDASEEEFLKTAEQHVEVLNHALRNVDGSRVRIHICWGNYEGPHHHDIELKKVLPVLLQAKPRTILFEAANPRHAHEWKVWKETSIPDDVILCPGVIDSTSNFIEHPELVAQRLENFVNIVGKERVVAGTDCGFATFAGFGKVHTDIVWGKLAALVQGAQLASKS